MDLINNMIHTQGLSYAEASTQIAATTAPKPGSTKNHQGKNSSGGGKRISFTRGTKPGSTLHPKKIVQVEDRYYSSEEYANMDPDQKLSLKLLREKKNSRGQGGKQGKKRSLPKAEMNEEWAKKLADRAAVAALKAQGGKKAPHPSLRGKSSDLDLDAE